MKPDARSPLPSPERRAREFTGGAPELTYNLEPHSLTTLRIPEK
jgi:hypothetical protein